VALLGGLFVLFLAIVGAGRRPRADFAFNNGAEVRSLDPAAVTGIAEGRVVRALFEGLTVLHPATLEPAPGTAARWDVSADGRTYTFHLRRDACWIRPGTDPARFAERGDPVIAHDFVRSWRRLLHPDTAAEYAYQLWCVRGARRYSEEPTSQTWGEVGIRAEGDHTLVVELERPTAHFLELTAFYPLYPIHLPSLEAARARWPDTWETEWVKPAHLVTNGPFRLRERRLHDRIRLARNPVYWDVENVGMRSIDILAVEHQVTMLNLYLTGEVDWISSVPTNLVPRLLERDDFRPALQLGTYFYRINVTRPPFDDVRVRQALALAIDRRALCEKITKAGQPPSWGFLPDGWRHYEPAALAHAPLDADFANWDEAFAADCARGRELLAEAGYGPDRPLPSISLHFNSSEVHRDIAEVIADGWHRELGVDARMTVQEFKVFLDTQKTLGYDVSRSSWMGDFVDPVNFLNVFRSDGANNRTGWGNARYDALLEEAADEPDAARRLALLAQADAILMDELPVIPLYTYVTQNLVNPRLGGFEPNVLDIHFLKFLHWRDDDATAEDRR